MTPATSIRRLTPAEVGMLVDWALVEGWNPGLADAAAFHIADPQGFLGCFVDGKMAAGISAVRYGADFGFIGLYISHPDFRGMGHGRAVWDAGMAHLSDRTVGLDGVPEQQANYRSMGFEAVYESFRWSGRLAKGQDSSATEISGNMIPDIVDYDRKFFPAERGTFLAEWLKPPRIARLILRNGDLRGYAVCRKCHDGYKVGPLFAETGADARHLLQACAAETAGEVLHIDLPASQVEFSLWLAQQGFSKGFTTARMYRGAVPPVRMASVFGITTLELG